MRSCIVHCLCARVIVICLRSCRPNAEVYNAEFSEALALNIAKS